MVGAWSRGPGSETEASDVPVQADACGLHPPS
ncbi:uncharacterized protein METZ01_LOCUS482561 [marine metagenome]|uniref:Uncharacterized protein n=1 Tax=marine metagenome TaxID=408172 RepID=A0A383CBF7_9ZZZZ